MPRQLAENYRAHLDTQRRRTESALQAAGLEHLLIYSGRPRVRFLDDELYPFKANPHLLAWLPLLQHEDCWIVYTPGETPKLIYYRPEDFWQMPPDKPRGFWVEHFDIREIAQPEAARKHFPPLEHTAVLGELPEELMAWGFSHVNPDTVLNALHFYRATKTAYELENLRRATALGVRAHLAAEQAFRHDASEYDIHLAYCNACSHREQELPYNNIVAINEHGAVLHYQHLDRGTPTSSDRHSLLIDAGATFNGYACDITRSYAYRQGLFGDLIEAVDAMQLEICATLGPGTDYKTLHLRAHEMVARILADFDLVNLPPEDIVSTDISKVFFPHGLGHYLGLQVHDVGALIADPAGTPIPKPAGHPFLRLTRQVDIDEVMTIEPGIYFIEPLLADLRTGEHARHVSWNRVDGLRKFGGIRIEDNVRITADGHENLTRAEFARQA